MWTEAKLSRLAQILLKKLNVRGAALDIFLLPNRDITALKTRFIKKKTEPNVLVFPEPAHFPHPELRGGGSGTRTKRYLGEIYLNRDILKTSPKRAASLLLHGLLHLLGYDHKKDADAKKMEKLEKRILSKKI